MLKQILITSTLLLGSTSQLSASPCSTYNDSGPSSSDKFFFVL